MNYLLFTTGYILTKYYLGETSKQSTNKIVRTGVLRSTDVALHVPATQLCGGKKKIMSFHLLQKETAPMTVTCTQLG